MVALLKSGLVSVLVPAIVSLIATLVSRQKLLEDKKISFQTSEGPWRKNLIEILEKGSWTIDDIQKIKSRLSLLVSVRKSGDFNEEIAVEIINNQIKHDPNKDIYMNILLSDQLCVLEKELKAISSSDKEETAALPVDLTENVRQLIRIQLKKNFEHNNKKAGKEGNLPYSDLNSILKVLDLTEEEEEKYRDWFNNADNT